MELARERSRVYCKLRSQHKLNNWQPFPSPNKPCLFFQTPLPLPRPLSLFIGPTRKVFRVCFPKGRNAAEDRDRASYFIAKETKQGECSERAEECAEKT
uniref:Uncharacterized protein n=1 Tax=Manihot esculenta TaxID=3983 RepID=A0A2C9U982_MANES